MLVGADVGFRVGLAVGAGVGEAEGVGFGEGEAGSGFAVICAVGSGKLGVALGVGVPFGGKKIISPSSITKAFNITRKSKHAQNFCLFCGA